MEDAVNEPTLTDDWIECFDEAKANGNLSSIFFRLALHTLPEGVDGDDPRVVSAINEIREMERRGL